MIKDIGTCLKSTNVGCEHEYTRGKTSKLAKPRTSKIKNSINIRLHQNKTTAIPKVNLYRCHTRQEWTVPIMSRVDRGSQRRTRPARSSLHANKSPPQQRQNNSHETAKGEKSNASLAYSRNDSQAALQPNLKTENRPTKPATASVATGPQTRDC